MFRYSSSGYNFVGNMHECIIYEGALSAEDIAAVEAYLDAKRAAYDGLPEVSSGALAAHFVADPSTMELDASNAVTAWQSGAATLSSTESSAQPAWTQHAVWATRPSKASSWYEHVFAVVDCASPRST